MQAAVGIPTEPMLTRFEYDLGHARDLAHERPTVSELQRASARALLHGDARRADVYQRVVLHRLEAAQACARQDAALRPSAHRAGAG